MSVPPTLLSASVVVSPPSVGAACLRAFFLSRFNWLREGFLGAAAALADTPFVLGTGVGIAEGRREERDGFDWCLPSLAVPSDVGRTLARRADEPVFLHQLLSRPLLRHQRGSQAKPTRLAPTKAVKIAMSDTMELRIP